MKKTTLKGILVLTMALLAFNASSQRNILVNGDFTQAFPAGWGTLTNTTITTKGLAPGSNASAYVANGALNNTISNPGADFTYECYLACAGAGGTNRAFGMNLDYAVFNLRINPTTSGATTGGIQIYNGSAWQAIGASNLIQYSTVGTGGSLVDADAVLNVYRLQVVFHGWGSATPTYDVYLSAANSTTLNSIATGLNYFQILGGKPTSSLSTVMIIGNQNTGIKFLLDGVKIITRNQVIKFSALSPKTTTDAPFGLTATSSVGLPVTYTSSQPSVAAISGSTVIINGTGTTDIIASAAGDALSDAATDVTQTLTVSIATGMTQTNSNVKVYVVNGKLVVSGSTDAVRAFTVVGTEVNISKKTLNPGVYIVKIGSETFKLSVR